jgi:hypothetical protein
LAVVLFAGLFLLRVDTFEIVVEQELVTSGRQELGGRALHSYTNDLLVELSQLVNQWREIGVTGADHKRGHVLALKGNFDGVYSHLDVGGVLSGGTHPLRDLDQLDMASSQGLAGVGEHRPIRICPTRNHTATLSKGVGDRLEIEFHATQRIPRADCQVFKVNEQCNAFFFHDCECSAKEVRFPLHSGLGCG